jgi:hypothetical protein
MATLSDIMEEFEATTAAGKVRRDANTVKALKGQADQLRAQRANGGLTPEQETALDAEISRLDPSE